MIAQQFIYFIRPIGMPGPVKIGCSISPERRLAELLTWSPYPLEIAASFPGSFKLERNLHEHFAHSHSHLEWFRPTPEIVEFVSKIAAGVAVEKAIDLAVRFPAIYRTMKSRPKPPYLRVYMSYFHRSRFAVLRAERELGERRFRNNAVDEILSDLRSGLPISDEQRGAFEAFIADPIKLSLSWDQVFPDIKPPNPAPQPEAMGARK